MEETSSEINSRVHPAVKYLASHLQSKKHYKQSLNTKA